MVGTNGHAVVAIGYQDDRDKTKLFCIDPSYPMDECQIWNNILEIDKSSKAKYNCLNYKEGFKVDVDEILYFLKKYDLWTNTKSSQNSPRPYAK